MLEVRVELADDSARALLDRLGHESLLAAIGDAIEGIEESCCDWADDDYTDEDGYGDEVVYWELGSLEQRGAQIVATAVAGVAVFVPGQDFPLTSSVPVIVRLHLDHQKWSVDSCGIREPS